MGKRAQCTWSRKCLSESYLTSELHLREGETLRLHLKHQVAAWRLKGGLLLDFLLWFGFDLDAFAEEDGVHASLGVGSRGVQQQVRQLQTGNSH